MEKIGVIGSAAVGQTLARGFSAETRIPAASNVDGTIVKFFTDHWTHAFAVFWS